jgi:hypothetical protein
LGQIRLSSALSAFLPVHLQNRSVSAIGGFIGGMLLVFYVEK